MRALLMLSLPVLLLSACAEQDGRGYPSLMKRPIEDGAPAGQGAVAIEAGTSSDGLPQLRQKIAELAAQASNSNIMFDSLYKEVAGRIRIARSAPLLSEQWVVAQMHLSRLEQARYPSNYALAALDTLYADRSQAIAAGEAEDGVAEIKNAIVRAQNIVSDQQLKIDALRAGLQQP